MLRIAESLADIVARLQRDTERLNVLCPAGIGDVAWILTKLAPVARKRGNVTFWLPQEEQQRAGRYVELLGLDYGYLERLSTRWVWDRASVEDTAPGAPEIPKTGCIAVQANTHLEAGRRIEEWYPKLPASWPQPDLSAAVKSTFQGPYCLLFPGSRNYMMGNLTVNQWSAIAWWLRKNVAPVRLVGAGHDIEFVNQISANYGTTASSAAGHILDRPIDEVLAAAVSPHCRIFAGVASGPLIASTYLGAPCFYGYPQHLVRQMPGTFEPPGAVSGHCLLQELPQRLDDIKGIAHRDLIKGIAHRNP